MPEGELEGLRTTGQRQQLVPQTDAKHRHLADQVTNRVDAIPERLRIARPIGEKHAVGVVGEHLGRRRFAGEHGHAAAGACQMPGDIPFHAIVEGDDMLAGGGRRSGGIDAPFRRLWERLGPFVERFGPLAFLRGHHLANEVAAHEPWCLPGHLHEFAFIEHLAREHARHCAANS